VAEGCDLGEPIMKSHPESPAAKAYRDLAASVSEQIALLNQERGSYLESFSLQWA
jgi:MinD-like ATPase involved in chromosome partitioning or flagellar assembly